MMHTVDLPPYAPILMESTRAIGYSFEAAVADIIDNCITALATKIDIEFFPGVDAFLSITDNGTGMNYDQLLNAMQYGSKNPSEIRSETDLGRYGLGLKTASLSQCRNLSVICLKEERLIGCRWDLNYISEVGKWSLIILTNEEIELLPSLKTLLQYKSGTMVVWKDFDKLGAGDSNFANNFSLKLIEAKEHLSLIFHRFLSGEAGLKKIQISINGKEVEPSDPFIVKKSSRTIDDEILHVHGKDVLVRV